MSHEPRTTFAPASLIARTAPALLLSIALATSGIAAQTPSGTGQEPPRPAAQHAFGKKIELKGVPGLEQVGPNLYRGNQPTKEGLENLAKMGIQIVVNMRLSTKAGERKRATALGMQFVSIPWFCMFPTDKIFAHFLQVIRDNPNKKIFIHCRLGDDRAGMAIAAYRIAEQEWTAEEARKEMVESGANWFHTFLCPTLAPYEKKFPEHFQTSPAFEKLRSTQPGSQARNADATGAEPPTPASRQK